ncbi:MAG: hypothetical protein R3C59_14130 [Planctomycetaceae bacterium]
MGYSAGVAAYQTAAAKLTARQLTTHYTAGLETFRNDFVPQLKQRLAQLSGDVWCFDDYIAFAAGSDVDFMTHLVEAVAAEERVVLYPGDWYGFRVGCSESANIMWDESGAGDLACLCIPSVRNGHMTDEMLRFLRAAPACLLNLNLYPTLAPADRKTAAQDLQPLLPKSVLSISFSRGFGLTASQLGVALIHRSHPYCQRFQRQWDWFTYFYNALAAQAFLEFDLTASQQVDRDRARWVRTWLEEHRLPVVETGSYYVKSFRVEGPLPDYLHPLQRDSVVRLCFKPPQT